MKVKICGLYREEDIQYINRYHPDYCGFIINFPKSHRNVSIEKLEQLSAMVDLSIAKVGVFVNEDPEVVISLLQRSLIDIAQLHGSEDEEYIRKIRKSTGKPIIKFFKIQSEEDIRRAEASSASYVLLDNGTGTGKTFDWSLLKNIKRPYFLAGGINIDNIDEACKMNPYALDISSGAETDKVKDEAKIRQLIQRIREKE